MVALISPSYIVIEQQSNETIFDDVRREIVGQIQRTTVVLKAQVSIGSSNNSSRKLGGQGGIEESKAGHLVFLQKDLYANGVTLRRGDRVIRIATNSSGSGGWETSMYLTRERRGGHWDSTGGGATQSLVIWHLADRLPAEP